MTVGACRCAGARRNRRDRLSCDSQVLARICTTLVGVVQEADLPDVDSREVVQHHQRDTPTNKVLATLVAVGARVSRGREHCWRAEATTDA